jgi:hypothetical protein
VESRFNVSAESLTFEKRLDFNKCSEGLSFYYFCVQTPCNSPIEDYTEMFYAIYEWTVPSIQCKMGLRRSTSTRDINYLGLLIDFYVPALTLHLR